MPRAAPTLVNAHHDRVSDFLSLLQASVDRQHVFLWSQVFNIGCDETAAKGVCTVESTFAFERRIFEAIASEFGKTPEGWEEAYFDAGAATNETIVNAWTRHTAADVVAKGFRVRVHAQAAQASRGPFPGCIHEITSH